MTGRDLVCPRLFLPARALGTHSWPLPLGKLGRGHACDGEPEPEDCAWRGWRPTPWIRGTLGREAAPLSHLWPTALWPTDCLLPPGLFLAASWLTKTHSPRDRSSPGASGSAGASRGAKRREPPATHTDSDGSNYETHTPTTTPNHFYSTGELPPPFFYLFTQVDRCSVIP